MTTFRKDLPSASRDTEAKREADEKLEEFRSHRGEWGLLADGEADDLPDKDLHNLANFHRRHFGESFSIAKRGNQVWARFDGENETLEE